MRWLLVLGLIAPGAALLPPLRAPRCAVATRGRATLDSKRERRSVNHAKIMASLDADGENSPYCKCVDPVTGCNGLHAAVINGYLELTKVREASPIER